MQGPDGCEQVQPFPVIIVAVTPSDRVFLTVTVPLVAAGPPFETLMMYSAFCKP